MSRHTPTPWVVHEDETTIETLGGLLITDVGSSFSGESEANAAFIVQAVNSHDALVEALKGILSNPGGRCTADQWRAGLDALSLATSPAAPADMEKQS